MATGRLGYALLMGSKLYHFSSKTWIADSGVSYMTKLVFMMSSQSMSLLRLKMVWQGQHKGKKDVIIKQVNSRITCYTLEPVKYCKQAKVNLFSLTSALPKEGVLSRDDQNNIVYQSRWCEDCVW